MTSSPIPECPEIHSTVTTELGVHLILRVDKDWDADRQAAVAELERKTQAATAFAASPAFKSLYGTRIGVLRVQSPAAAPSIVAHLLSEQGIELEQLPASAADPQGTPAESQGVPAPTSADAPGCSFCPRQHLPTEKATMTDSGWACPACFRVWTLKNQPQLLTKERRLRFPPRLILPLIIAVAVLFALGAYYELRRLNSMNRVIRQHLPTE
ncbi:MAG TPA: hypothetical protein PLW65_11985 [Pseudomonadota bacterium]|nr:hypothetical protein [Pseudomonadota bacterium]